MPKYSIGFDLDNTYCQRCGANLRVAVYLYVDGKEITVGRECAKHYGIVWTEAVGPMADDYETFCKAVSIFRHLSKNIYINGDRWPGGWDACNQIKQQLGTKAWKRAQTAAHHRINCGCVLCGTGDYKAERSWYPSEQKVEHNA